jgi:MinD superfamily P-loop ATPase
MPTLRIDHEKCTECRMCYVACEEIGINAVYIDLEPRHRFEIDDKCTYPGCVVCLMYCPAPGSIVETATGRSLVPPPPELWRDASTRWPRESLPMPPERR